MPIIPATWEAEAGELLEPGRQRLQWAEIVPLPSNLWKTRAKLHLKKKKKKHQKHSYYRCLLNVTCTLYWEQCYFRKWLWSPHSLKLKRLDEHIGEDLCGTGLGDSVLDMIPQSTENKNKIKTNGLHQTKGFCTAKKTEWWDSLRNGREFQMTEQELISQNTSWFIPASRQLAG